MSIQVKSISSLEKVFTNYELTTEVDGIASRFQNESYAFQVAYKGEPTTPYFYQYLKVEVTSPLEDYITLNRVGLVPSEFPAYQHGDDDYITKEPGLFPDPLMPLEGGMVKILPRQWRALWVEVGQVPENISGTFPITVSFKNGQGDVVAQTEHYIKILEGNLPEQKLIHTEWFHVDCLSNYYNVPVFSDAHWTRVEQYIQTAADHGINMILTPLFTPPLDTEVGGERTTVQLVDVAAESGVYTFGFEKLERWITICKNAGVTYLEMSHLFTQWGATAIPKIMATVDGTYKQIFGWNDSATGDAYRAFLQTFLPQLIEVIKKHGMEKRCYFHISDEPSLHHLEDYKKAKDMIKDLIADFPIIDALSDIDFYRSGAIAKPIPSNDHVHTFIEEGVKDLWTYYCCAQCTDVSNRFMSMPSSRNRILATQLFKYDMEGFLHWGYNFWNVQFSKYAIDPFKVTDAGAAFPSGDSFLVYPGEEGPISSIRMKVLRDALQDLRAMEYLETLTSKEYVMALIEKNGAEPITFSSYPRTASYILNLRNEINQHIVEHIG
ncbi:MAG: DUF4091 domain-containing protein [Cellulosilyticaceae bacterium]